MLSNKNTVNTSKNKTFTYNLLNLPQQVTVATGTSTFIYDATGNKLRKITALGTAKDTLDYIRGIQYKNRNIDFIQTEEGKIAFNKTTGVYDYEYYLGDNLGNTRVTFNIQNSVATALQRDDYMPFGYEISNGSPANPKNEYLYNKKELQEELNQYDYGARFYDPLLGRWNAIDELAEKSRRWSPYNYVMNNPIRLIDPDGRDTAQIKAALEEAKRWIAANKNGKGNTYGWGDGKKKPKPGCKIDCSGFTLVLVKKGGEKDPNYGKAPNGVTNYDNNLPNVDPKDVKVGNLVLLNDDSHIGMLSRVEKYENGNIINEFMYDSGGRPERNKGTGPSGPRETQIIKDGRPVAAYKIGSYKKWDTRPDSEPDNKGSNNNNRMPQNSQPQSQSLLSQAWNWLIQVTAEGNYQ